MAGASAALAATIQRLSSSVRSATLDLARQLAVQVLQVGGDALVERDPVERQVLGAGRLDHVRPRVGHHAADVGLGVLGERAAPLPVCQSLASSAALSRPTEEIQ